MIVDINGVYICCGIFILFKMSILVYNIYRELVLITKAIIMVNNNFG